jgi:hypothetical protein
MTLIPNIHNMTASQMKSAILVLAPDAKFDGDIISEALNFGFDRPDGPQTAPISSHQSVEQSFREIVAVANAPAESTDKTVLVGYDDNRRKVTGFNFQTNEWTYESIH